VNKRSLPALVFLVAGALVVPTQRALAHDESGDVSVKINAPLDAVDCSATPPTVSVLTLNVDVTGATFESGEGEGDDDGAGACAGLTTGSSAEVKLASDALPLTATEVSQEGDDDDENSLALQAPVQAVDVGAKTITLLGLTIDASAATLEGCDDDDDQGSGQPVDLTQILVGQILDVRLDPATLPSLVATRIRVKNFTNEVSVSLEDEHGQQVDDASDDVAVDVTTTVRVKQTRPGKASRIVKKTLHLQFRAHGSFVVPGLPKGTATISIVRNSGGAQSAARRVVRVLPNKSRAVKVRLHKTRS
jgi:Domain of unknown function (DUF5666)